MNEITLPRWAVMWLLALAIYAACKLLTWRRARIAAPLWKHLAYLFAWPGLDAVAFLSPSEPDEIPRPRRSEWAFATLKLLLGISLFLFLPRHLSAWPPYPVGWVGMIGIVTALHFGLFHLLSCLWRSMNIQAKPLMRWPLLSESVSEFWGRRWNIAFRDLTHRFLFRPLTARVGLARALFLGFVFSGVIHDLVISIPAGGGYGGPTLFFLLHGVAILLERTKRGRRLGLGRGWKGWLFTLFVLIAPAILLFHPPFVHNIVLPMMHDLGVL